METVRVAWDNPEQTIIRYEFDQGWTWDAYYAAAKIGDTLIDNASHSNPVGAILWMPNPTLPPNVLRGAYGGMRTRHPRAKIVVIVTTNPFVRALHNVVVTGYKTLRDEFLRANTLEEARTLLNEQMGKQWKQPDEPKP